MTGISAMGVDGEHEEFEGLILSERSGDGDGEEEENQDAEEGRYDETVLTEFLTLNGWCSSSSVKPFWLRPVQRNAHIPSPFVRSGSDINQKIWNLINSTSVRKLWRQLREEGIRPNEAGFLAQDGSEPCCAVFQEVNPNLPEVVFYSIKESEGELDFAIDDLVVPLIPETSGKIFRLRRLNRANGLVITKQQGFFVINQDSENLVINGEVMGRDAVAGPLPDFAVIEFESITIFWWRDVPALEYVPSMQGGFTNSTQAFKDESRPNKTSLQQNRKRGLSEAGSEGGSGESRARKRRNIAEEKDSSLNRWQKILGEGLARHHRCRIRKEASQRVHTTVEQGGISEEDSILAIASFWEALRQNGTLYAYAGMDVFGQTVQGDAEFRLGGQGVVGAPQSLIMPLMLHPQNRKGQKAVLRTESLGHLVLGVAKYNKDNGKIYISIRDSAPGYRNSGVTKQTIEDRAKEMITESCWPFDKSQQLTPTFADVKAQDVPRQEGIHNCGFYQVINAWCSMLKIPIHPAPLRRIKPADSLEFLQQGFEIVNLALMGCMDAHTFQAFANVWGYSVEQGIEQLVDNVTAIRMTHARLRSRLRQQAALDGRGPPRENIAAVLEFVGDAFTAEQVQEALVEEDGNVERAGTRLLSPPPVSSTAGSPTPKTPPHRRKFSLPGSDASHSPDTKAAIALSKQTPSPATPTASPGHKPPSIAAGTASSNKTPPFPIAKTFLPSRKTPSPEKELSQLENGLLLPSKQLDAPRKQLKRKVSPQRDGFDTPNKTLKLRGTNRSLPKKNRDNGKGENI